MDKNEIYQYAGFHAEEIAELERDRCSLNRKASLFSFNTKKLQFEPLVVSCHDSAHDLNNEVDQPQCRAHLFLLIDNLPFAISEMQKKNIPDDIIRATFSDISLWSRNYKRQFGVYGLSSRIWEWVSHHLGGKLYQLGLLQFEVAPLSLEVGGVCTGDPILKVHIPEGRRLLSDLCDQSFQQAEWFFKDILPYDFQAYIFDSWLCDQELMRLLPESSNILKFVKRFIPVSQSVVKNDEIYQRVFGGRAVQTGTVDYPLKTSLQKILYPYFKEKILFGSGVGIILKDPSEL